jgi:hypothetical protein
LVRALDDHRSKESIASPGNGLNKAGAFRVVAQGFTQLANGYAQAVVEFDESVVRPKPLTDLVSSDDLAGPFDKQDQQAKGQILQLYADAVTDQATFLRIEMVGSDAVSQRFWR